MTRGIRLALLSAVLFGASTPLAKLLLGEASPWMVAGLLYLGAGAGLLILREVMQARAVSTETPLARADLPWLALVVLFGGIGGPLLLMLGLMQTDAASASLLLNLEGLATMLIAWVVLRENVDGRLLLGALAILAGAVVLSWQGGASLGVGAVFIALACLCWGIDNNLTRKLSSSDPLQIATVKGVCAGIVNTGIALWLGGMDGVPGVGVVIAAAVVGFLGYGLSLALFVLALRDLGAARTGAYFSTAPFVGAVLALVIFQQAPTLQLVVAGVLMGIGLWLHLTERHEHDHVHEAMEHDHSHVHDAHHQHDHDHPVAPGRAHSHRHRHTRLVHQHPHFPDLHHRHDHVHHDGDHAEKA
jgi:drug/metabolite transporter (DMT)-like permease